MNPSQCRTYSIVAGGLLACLLIGLNGYTLATHLEVFVFSQVPSRVKLGGLPYDDVNLTIPITKGQTGQAWSEVEVRRQGEPLAPVWLPREGAQQAVLYAVKSGDMVVSPGMAASIAADGVLVGVARDGHEERAKVSWSTRFAKLRCNQMDILALESLIIDRTDRIVIVDRRHGVARTFFSDTGVFDLDLRVFRKIDVVKIVYALICAATVGALVYWLLSWGVARSGWQVFRRHPYYMACVLLSYAAVGFIMYPGLYGQDILVGTCNSNGYTAWYSEFYMFLSRMVYLFGKNAYPYFHIFLVLVLHLLLLDMLDAVRHPRVGKILCTAFLCLCPIILITIFSVQRFYTSTLFFSIAGMLAGRWLTEKLPHRALGVSAFALICFTILMRKEYVVMLPFLVLLYFFKSGLCKKSITQFGKMIVAIVGMLLVFKVLAPLPFGFTPSRMADIGLKYQIPSYIAMVGPYLVSPEKEDKELWRLLQKAGGFEIYFKHRDSLSSNHGWLSGIPAFERGDFTADDVKRLRSIIMARIADDPVPYIRRAWRRFLVATTVGGNVVESDYFSPAIRFGLYSTHQSKFMQEAYQEVRSYLLHATAAPFCFILYAILFLIFGVPLVSRDMKLLVLNFAFLCKVGVVFLFAPEVYSAYYYDTVFWAVICLVMIYRERSSKRTTPDA